MRLKRNVLALAVLLTSFIADNGFAVNNHNQIVRPNQWFEAAVSGDTDTMKRAISQRFDINMRHQKLDQTALSMAIAENKVEVVKLLLNHNASLVELDSANLTAFSRFMKYSPNCSEIASLLCAKGADLAELNMISPYRRTRLYDMLSYSKEHTKTLDILLSQENSKIINLDEKDILELSLLHRAALSGHHNIVKLLIERGANVMTKSKTGETLLFFTTNISNQNEKQHDYHGLIINNDNRAEKVSHLHEIINAYIDNGVDINHQNQWGFTAAMWAMAYCKTASKSNNLATVKGWYNIAWYLIKHPKFNVWLQDNKHRTILEYASISVVMRKEILWKMLIINEGSALQQQHTTAPSQKRTTAQYEVFKNSPLVRKIVDFL